jgi:hypothetical protein
MSYESTKTSSNSTGGETMTSDQSSANNFHPRTQAMIMNPMMSTGHFYNGPPQSAPTQMPNRSMYQSYPSAPPHHHQIVSFCLLFF